MLHQLIESKNHGAENARKNSFLITTLGVLVAVLLSGWTYSLFAKNFGMGTGDFEFASLVAPVVPAEEPPAPEPEQKQPERRQTESNNERLTVIDKVPRMEDSLDNPPKIEDSRQIKSAPLKADEWDKFKEGSENNYGRREGDGTENGEGLKQTPGTKPEDEDDKLPEVVVKPTPAPTVKAVKPAPKSGGVLNGKAISLVKPPYPPAAKAMGIKDTVTVQVLIDEQGNVISATAASGHVLLRAAAVQAARQTKFSPTKLSDQPVRVTGVIIYNFQ